jgi:predicted ATP-dependent protease
MISTTGQVIGQVNGLSVWTGTEVFGKPFRITATTSLGKSGIIHIDKESELGGPTQTKVSFFGRYRGNSKGLLIITGYLHSKFAAKFPITLQANLCAEQVYDPQDGDSASAAEIFALLSSISQLPIKQNIAGL